MDNFITPPEHIKIKGEEIVWSNGNYVTQGEAKIKLADRKVVVKKTRRSSWRKIFRILYRII